MIKLILSFVFVAFMSVSVQAGTLLPPALQQIEDLQRRADKQVFTGVGSDNYHLAKARTWIDFALSEYHQNDTTGITLAAIEYAKTLLDALDNEQGNINMITPNLVPGTEVVRTDLWQDIATLKQSRKFSCGQRQLAEAEVHLVWAGHEKYESGWSHAKSYARTVENLIYEAQVAIDNCGTGAVETVIEKRNLSSDALFAFNSAELSSAASENLEKIIATLNGWKTVESITLIGHTDRFGSDMHNQILSKQRARHIKQYLVKKGIAVDRITVIGAGSARSLVTCSVSPPKPEQVRCLQPNRRVEITLRGTK